jgi:glycosyltransferase involved in cell wall biosynthesis
MLLTPNLDVGGAQETAHNLAKYLPRTGHPTVVCTLADGPLRPEIEALGVRVEVLPPRRHSIVALPRFAAELARVRRSLAHLLDHHRVGVVLQTQANPTLSLVALSFRTRRHLQVWWTIQNTVFLIRRDQLTRNFWLLGTKRFVHRWLYRIGGHWVHGVIAVSDETAIAVRALGIPDRKITVVCNAVDLERYPAAIDRDVVRAALGFRTEDHMMTMVGTFKRQKGHVHLIDAASSVVREHPELQLVLVGDGPLLGDVRAQALAAGIGERVHFLGTRRDVPALLAASDSFVLPSLWEGLPLALVEAMAGDLPVIATRVSGTEQVMVDGRTGWVVPPGEASALADAMRELLADERRAATMAASAHLRATRFSAEAQATTLSNLFERGAA